jgi:hypothetical protein
MSAGRRRAGLQNHALGSGADLSKGPQNRQQPHQRARRNGGEQARVPVGVEGMPLSRARERVL